jgi:FKBP-type peptidyl-prolyl cis-trans isomerase FkpA
MRFFLLLSVVALLFSGCKKDKKDSEDIDYSERDDEIILDYLALHSIDAQKDAESGIYYVIKALGEGDVVSVEDSVVVRYIGKVLSRKNETDTVELATKPFDFTPAAEPARRFKLSKLIEGWKVGIPKIHKNGSIDLYIPSAKAYGNNYQSGIPANSVLYFDIDLEDVVKSTE